MTRKREEKDDTRWPRPVWIWSNANGARSLVQAFQSEGINGHLGWQRLQPEEISDDGRNIVGFGQNPQDQSEGWTGAPEQSVEAPISVALSTEVVTVRLLLAESQTHS